ncbi:hypothetical protein [Streptomyces sp. NPDC004330]|uniref:hypothetical protein n=1 Tax=Streptomyces sp. NPDC004330 TaxID=3364700 RepID=UPI0036A7920F
MDRFGSVVATSVSVLLVEAVIGITAAYVWDRTQETPPLPYNALGLVLMVIAAPFVAAAGGALCALLAVGVVVPVLTAAAWLGRRLSGREAWWWVPVTAAAAALPAAPALVLLTDAGFAAGLAGWVTAATALTAPALVARRLLLPDRPRLSGRTMVGQVALYGTLAAVTAFALAGVALFAGVAYEPPWFNPAQLAGTYSDGKGGTLTLTRDGAAVATRIDTFDFEAVDSFDPVVRECTGVGTWSFSPVDGPHSQQVDVSVDACPVDMDSWSLYGTRESPKLFVFVGDPDSWDLYTLRRE